MTYFSQTRSISDIMNISTPASRPDTPEQPIVLIQPVPVVRDEEGYWVHPGEPDFHEDGAAYRDWLERQGLETSYKSLEFEDNDHPAYLRYFEEMSGDISDWNPSPPAGDGWWTLSIHQTEDSAVWVWARRVEVAA